MMADITEGPIQHITLANPVADQYETFIVANAIQWEQMATVELQRDAPDVYGTLLGKAEHMERTAFTLEFRNAVLTHCGHPGIVTQDSAKGQHVVICGAGPSLRDHARKHCRSADQVWGCNSALTYLTGKHIRVTHGFAIDQTPAMVNEWKSAPDVEYLLASTVHPHLVDLLQSKGRRLTYFHNYVGIRKPPVSIDGEVHEYEDWLYACLFSSTIRAGSGLNSVTRAIDVALFMGFDKITVLGADHAIRAHKPLPKGAMAGSPAHVKWLKNHTIMHADGGHALASGATPMTISGEIDGRMWHTKPDMMISAVFLVKMAHKLNGRLEIIGDTLPGALMDKDDAYLRRLPTLVDSSGKPLEFI